MSNNITDYINISSDDSDREDSYYSDKEKSNESVRYAGKYQKTFSFIEKIASSRNQGELFVLDFKKLTKQTKSSVNSPEL